MQHPLEDNFAVSEHLHLAKTLILIVPQTDTHPT